MPVIVSKSGVDYYLVPAPLVTFSKQVYNNVGRPGFGADYTVTLQGTLVQTHGNPYYVGGVAGIVSYTGTWSTTSEVEPAEITAISGVSLLNATIKKQELIRNLFTNPSVSGVAKPIKISIRGWNESGADAPGSGLAFMAFVDDVQFDSDGRWANPNSYTVNLRTSSFLNSANDNIFGQFQNENAGTGYYISNLTDTIDVQEDGRTTLTFSGQNLISSNKVYALNRSITAVGSPVYDDSGNYKNGLPPWRQAKEFVTNYIAQPGPSGFFDPSGLIGLASTAIGLMANGSYKIANFASQESIDKEAGSYTRSETALLYSGTHPVIETLTIDIQTAENNLTTVNVQGEIQGLNTVSGTSHTGNAYFNAWDYFTGVLDTGIPVAAYFWAKGSLKNTTWLHPKQLNKSVGKDFSRGVISYSYSFDDRPPNVLANSISESISISDTYPGQLFSVTPVIGRSQPVLQYLNSRSEYKRSLSINITMPLPTGYYQYLAGWPSTTTDITAQGSFTGSNTRANLQSMYLTKKPSIAETSGLNEIFQAVNPVNDPFIMVAPGKCFHSAPNESWDPKTGNYSYNIEWTYERM